MAFCKYTWTYHKNNLEVKQSFCFEMGHKVANSILFNISIKFSRKFNHNSADNFNISDLVTGKQ